MEGWQCSWNLLRASWVCWSVDRYVAAAELMTSQAAAAGNTGELSVNSMDGNSQQQFNIWGAVMPFHSLSDREWNLEIQHQDSLSESECGQNDRVDPASGPSASCSERRKSLTKRVWNTVQCLVCCCWMVQQFKWVKVALCCIKVLIQESDKYGKREQRKVKWQQNRGTAVCWSRGRRFYRLVTLMLSSAIKLLKRFAK